MTDWNRITAELQKPLDPAAIKPPPKGKFGEYVDGYHVITEANRIFGHDGWSYQITRLEQTSGQVYDLTGNNGPYQQYRCSYLCTVRVTAGGVTREGAAVGMGNGKPENTSDVIESAVKEAETDALKRALRSFGNTFGLALRWGRVSRCWATESLEKRQQALIFWCSFVQAHAERGRNTPPGVTHHRHSLFTGRSHPTASLVQS